MHIHEKTCKNGCKFATKFHLMSYANKNTDGTYSDADYLYKCSVLGYTISFDSTIYKLGCATFENECQNARVAEAEALVAEVNKKVDEIEKIMPVAIPVSVSESVTVVPEAVVEKPAELTAVQSPVERVEPKFVPEPTTHKSEPMVELTDHVVFIPPEKTDTPKKRGRRPAIAASVVNPVVSDVQKE